MFFWRLKGLHLLVTDLYCNLSKAYVREREMTRRACIQSLHFVVPSSKEVYIVGLYLHSLVRKRINLSTSNDERIRKRKRRKIYINVF